MTWSDTGELIKAIAAVATALAAWFAASVAYRGLEKWRTETLGKRKAELAASVLAAVYEFEEVIRSGREPWVLPHEMAKREGIPDEIAQNANYAPEARLLAQQAFFARFRSMKHEFAAVFGRESAKIFDGLWRVRLDINHAVDFMLREKEMQRSKHPEDKKVWNEWYRTAFRHPDPKQDGVAQRVAELVAAAEDVCRPAIEARER